MAAMDCACNDTAASDKAVHGGQESIGSALYTGTATFGRVYSTIGALIGVIIALILIVVGFSRLRDPRTKQASATVVAVSSCTPTTQDKVTTYTCLVSATYVVDGKAYTAKNLSISSGAPVLPGRVFTIQYDPSKPENSAYELPPKMTGWALVGLGLVIGGVTVGVAVMTYKSKGFAAGYGALEGIGMLTSR